jgi:hypothetical protein
MRGLFRLAAVIVLLAGAGVYLNFGTISPCGILRESARQHDGLAAVLPDGLVDAALIAQFGALSPGVCLRILTREMRKMPRYFLKSLMWRDAATLVDKRDRICALADSPRWSLL